MGEQVIEIPVANNQGSNLLGKILLSVFMIIGLFMLIFTVKTVLANSSATDAISNPQEYSGSKLTIKVDIPCSGHASLIIYEVKKLSGVNEVKFKGSGVFDVYYDSSKTSKEEILSAGIFNEYPARAQ